MSTSSGSVTAGSASDAGGGGAFPNTPGLVLVSVDEDPMGIREGEKERGEGGFYLHRPAYRRAR